MFLPQARKSLIIIDNQAFHHVSPNFSNSVDDSQDQTVDRIKIEYHLPILTIHHTPTRLPFRPFPLNIFLFLHKLTDLYTPVQKTSVIPEKFCVTNKWSLLHLYLVHCTSLETPSTLCTGFSRNSNQLTTFGLFQVFRKEVIGTFPKSSTVKIFVGKLHWRRIFQMWYETNEKFSLHTKIVAFWPQKHQGQKKKN